MIEFESFHRYWNFARHNLVTSIVMVIFLLFGYLGYQFLGGYASTLGESFAHEYGYFQRSVASYTVVDNILREYLDKFGASRVAIARFHDSVRDPANNPIFFVTAETIVTAAGVTADISQMKEMPAITLAPVMEQIMANHTVFLWTRDVPSGPLRELLDHRGDRASLYVPLHDLGDHIVGVLLVSWLSEREVPSADKRAKVTRDLQMVADRLGVYFSAR